MNFPACTVNIDAKTTDKEKCNIVFNLFLKAYEDALLDSIRADAKVDSMKEANAKATQAFMNDDSQAGGFGPPDPFSGHSIAYAKSQGDTAKENMRQAKVMLTFIREILGKPRIRRSRKKHPIGKAKNYKGSIQFTSTLSTGQTTTLGSYSNKGPLDSP